MRIGIDIMGGDFAPQKTVQGAILAQKELPEEDYEALKNLYDLFLHKQNV